MAQHQGRLRLDLVRSHRAVSMLRAVRAGRAHLLLGCEPGLFVDGLPCCDQFATGALVREGLVRAERPGRIGELVPAVLTPAGLLAVS